MKYWNSKATHSYLSVNKIKQAPVNLQGQILFVQQQILDYRARAKAGAGAAILTSSSRSRVKMERLHNTGFENTGTYHLSMCRILIFLRIIQVPTRNLPSTTLLKLVSNPFGPIILMLQLSHMFPTHMYNMLSNN